MCLLRCMKDGLKKNICRVSNRSKLNKEVENLAERNANHIGVSLAYACRYWADHLSLVALPKNLTENCVRMVDEVVRTRLLYWIEALSLLGDIYVAMPSIAEVGHWYSVCLQRILH